MVLNLENLPVEIISRIFTILHLDSLLNVGRTCRHLRSCYNQEIIWKQLCSRYQFWDSNPTISYDTWQELYIARFKKDRIVDSIIDSCIQDSDLSSNVAHFQRLYNDIAQEAKDRLFHHMRAPDDAPDVLARRWWANELLLFLHRAEAMKDLFRVLFHAEPFAEENVLTAFDMLIRRDCLVDQACVSYGLDEIVDEFKVEYPRFGEYNTRDLALKIAQFMTISKNFHAPSSGLDYYEPANNFISYCLTDPEHGGLQITHSSIYCAIARRLGLDAKVIGPPESVMAIVYTPYGKSLDGKNLSKTSGREKIYVDPYRDDAWERSEADINRLISLVDRIPDYQVSDRALMLEPMKASNFIIRVGNNLINCLQIRESRGPFSPLSRPKHDLQESAIFYAITLVDLILKTAAALRGIGDASINPMFRDERVDYGRLPEKMESDQPWDLLLLYELCRNEITPFLQPRLRLFAIPSIPRHPKQRSNFKDQLIRYSVGTVFNHRRYGYTGVIVGWDESCAQNIFWQATQNVNQLPGGPNQPFYSVMSVRCYLSCCIVDFCVLILTTVIKMESTAMLQKKTLILNKTLPSTMSCK
jgi:F-box protein 21